MFRFCEREKERECVYIQMLCVKDVIPLIFLLSLLLLSLSLSFTPSQMVSLTLHVLGGRRG